MCSRDGHNTAQDLAAMVKARSLDGIAVTDHNVLSKLRVEGMIVIPGMEISTKHGHLLAFDVTTPLRRNMSADETVEMIHAQGGIAVLPHPYDLLRSSLRPKRLLKRVDAVETINASAPLFHLSKWFAEGFARHASLPMTGGSDSHLPETIGKAYTIVDAETSSVDDIIDSIRNGKTQACGNPVSLLDRTRKLKLDLNRVIFKDK